MCNSLKQLLWLMGNLWRERDAFMDQDTISKLIPVSFRKPHAYHQSINTNLLPQFKNDHYNRS